MPFLVALLAILLSLPATSLADEVDSLTPIQPVALPGQSSYTGAGVSFGLGGGIFSPIEDCDCMGTWQAQLEYFYSDWVSGGLEIRIYGGDVDRDAMVMYQRYRVNVKMHRFMDDVVFYVSPFLGFESTNISEFRKQVRGESGGSHWWKDDDPFGTEESDGECEKLFAMDGFTVGLGMGGGYNFSRLFSATGLVQLEYNLSDDVMFNVVPGIAFNLREVWPWAKRALRSTWVSFEIGGQRYFNRDVDGWSNIFVLGIQLGA